MSRSPTFSETYDSLLAVASDAQKALYLLGVIRERNDEKTLKRFVAVASKRILNHLPCLQFEDDAIEEIDSKYGHRLNQLEEEAGQ